MSAILGNVNKFYVKIGSATTYTWLTGEQNNSVNRTQEAIEVSPPIRKGSWVRTPPRLNYTINLVSNN